MKAKRLFLAGILLLALCGGAMAQANFAPPESVPYSPFVISFVPMLSVPFGYYDTSMSLATIGGMAHDIYGFMGAGVFNLSHDVHGFQGAGVFNISQDVEGFQGAGVFNIAANVNVCQGAGVFNIADKVDGFQVAGVFNMAGDVNGVQAAPVFNIARDVRGVQIGLVNIADELDGLQIGLVNIAHNGVNGPSAWLEPDTGYGWATWQNGSRYLYSVMSVGAPVSDIFVTADHVVAAFGIGTRLGQRHGLFLDSEILVANEVGSDIVNLGNLLWDATTWRELCLRSYPEIRFRLGLPVGRSLAVIAGLTVDVDLADNPQVPAALHQGMGYTDTWFGESFTAYTRWYLGLKF